MGLLQRFENRLEAVVSGAFARAFRSSVQPVELAAALQREVDNNAQVLSRERRLVPNDFHIELSPTDYARLAPYAASLTTELTDVLREHAEQQSYVFAGPIKIAFEEADDLGTGRFRVRSKASASVAVSPELAQPKVPAPVAPTPPPFPMPAAPAPSLDGVEDDDLEHDELEDADVDEAPAPPSAPPPAPPAPMVTAFLEVNGVRQPLAPPGLVIGRGAEADIRINDPGVSRRHAEIQVSRGATRPNVTVVDLGSTNGTHVNGYRVDRAALSEGTQVSIGNTVLTVRFEENGPVPDPEDDNGDE